MSHINERSSSSKKKKPRLIDELGISPDSPVELAVWSVKKRAIDCKHIPTLLPVTLKWERYYQYEIEGEIITVKPSKVWMYKGNVKLTGEITNRKLDISALNLTSLPLEEKNIFDPENEDDLLEGDDDPYDKYYIPLMLYGPRNEYELKQSLTIEMSEDLFGNPFSALIENEKDRDSLFEILREFLTKDFRCIDAHAYLGNLEFNVNKEIYPFLKNKAMRHYQVGMRIAELSFGPVFYDLLPWEYKHNRPYLRCLYGYALCLWRNGQTETAKDLFEKILWLNPRDEQGVRFLLDLVSKGRKWDDMEVD
jgi:tetratricopeptide (TPR) repeat protein